MKMEQTERSETSAYKIQMPGNYPEERKHTKSGLFVDRNLAVHKQTMNFHITVVLRVCPHNVTNYATQNVYTENY